MDDGTLVLYDVSSNEEVAALTYPMIPCAVTHHSPFSLAWVVLEKFTHWRLKPFTVMLEVVSDTPAVAAYAFNPVRSFSQYLPS